MRPTLFFSPFVSTIRYSYCAPGKKDRLIWIDAVFCFPFCFSKNVMQDLKGFFRNVTLSTLFHVRNIFINPVNIIISCKTRIWNCCRECLYKIIDRHMIYMFLLIKIALKGHCTGLNLAKWIGTIWPTREEAAPSVPKNILLTFESNTDTRLSFPIYYRCFHNCTVQDHF